MKKNILRAITDNYKKGIVVAEISANHGRSLKKAVLMMKEIKKCGAEAVKFQTYTPDTLTIDVNNEFFRVKLSKWKGQTLYQLYRKAFTPWGWFKKLKRVSDDLGLFFLSTSFDKTAVDFLEELGVAAHKIASFELNDLPLIEYAAKTGKPLIMSTGMATESEIREAVKTARDAGTKEIMLLKCVSNYPAEPKEMNLATIHDMQKRFGCPVGLSDHTLGIAVAAAARSLGAVLIEKHFTMSRKDKTADSFFSIEPDELRELVNSVNTINSALGEVRYGATVREKDSRIYRRSLFAVRDIRSGEMFTADNIRSIRPAYGMPPKKLNFVLGKKARVDIKRGTPLSGNLITGK